MSRSRLRLAGMIQAFGLVAIGIASLLVTVPVAAAATGGAETWLGLPVWVWKWLNLIVLWGILIRYGGPMVRNFFAERRAQIETTVGHAAEQRREAEEMRASLGARIGEIREQVDSLLERADRDGERERREILEQAEEERQRILEQTRAEIERGVSRAKTELAVFTADLATRLAERDIAGRLDGSERKRLFRESLERLEGIRS